MTVFLKESTLIQIILSLNILVLVAAAYSDPDVIPGRYIVEFADQQDNHQNAFTAELSTSKIQTNPRLSISSSLFNGASFSLHEAHTVDTHSEQKTVEQIASLKSVKNVFPMRKYSLPYNVISLANGTGKFNIASKDTRGKESKKTIHRPQEDTYVPHVMTGVDKLRAEGYTGAGINIAIIDTGIDYKHHDLGGCFGPGCKITHGYDFVGDHYTGDNDPVPDDDPYDDCAGHGTHVAGIIAASGTEQDYFVGVAPNITLGAYRVLGCEGGVSNDILIKAFLMAYESSADVITSSIGSLNGWSEEPLDTVVSRIVAAGIPCTISAGNSGSKGPFTSSSPADAIGATAISSVDNSAYPMILVPGKYFIDMEETGSEFGWDPGNLQNITAGIYPLYATSFNTSSADDACHESQLSLRDGHQDLSRHIVLIRRGGCSLSRKAGNAAARGAKNILFYNTEPGLSRVYVYAPGIQSAGMVPVAQAEEWIRLLRTGAVVHLRMVPPNHAGLALMDEPNTLTGGYVSTFTSWGPTFEVGNKPQVAAPGGLIASTYPLELGGYAVLSGTSMSCPFVAGAIALIMEARGSRKLSPEKINWLLVSTATPAVFHDGQKKHPYLAPVAQQGAGLVNVYDAVHATTLINTSGLSFNDTDHTPARTGFHLYNKSPVEVTYNIAHVPGVSFYALAKDGTRDEFSNGSPTMIQRGAEFTFSTKEITVPPGKWVYIQVTPSPLVSSGGGNYSIGLDARRIPVYSGYIAVTSSSAPNYHASRGEAHSFSHDHSIKIPYTGVSASLKNDAPVLNKNKVYLSSSSRPDYPWAGNYRFSLPEPGSERAKYPGILAPAIYADMVMGSPLVRIDVQPVGYTDGDRYGDGNEGVETKNILGYDILGSIAGFPASYVSGGMPVQASWHGKLGDGSYAPEGNYTLLVRALKIFGNPEEKDDYEVSKTEVFGILYG